MTSLIRIEHDVIMDMKWYHNGVTDLIMSVMLISVSHTYPDKYRRNISNECQLRSLVSVMTL